MPHRARRRRQQRGCLTQRRCPSWASGRTRSTRRCVIGWTFGPACRPRRRAGPPPASKHDCPSVSHCWQQLRRTEDRVPHQAAMPAAAKTQRRPAMLSEYRQWHSSRFLRMATCCAAMITLEAESGTSCARPASGTQAAVVVCLPALACLAAWAFLHPPAPSARFAAGIAAAYALGVAAYRALVLESQYEARPPVALSSLQLLASGWTRGQCMGCTGAAASTICAALVFLAGMHQGRMGEPVHPCGCAPGAMCGLSGGPAGAGAAAGGARAGGEGLALPGGGRAARALQGRARAPGQAWHRCPPTQGRCAAWPAPPRLRGSTAVQATGGPAWWSKPLRSASRCVVG
jgi:hypothetical protein